MKTEVWTKTLLQAYKYSGRVIPCIDKLVMKYTINSHHTGQGGNSTMQVFEEVIKVMEYKKRLLKLRLLVEEGLRSLESEYSYLLVRYFIDNCTTEELAESLRMSCRTVNRRVKEALGQCYFKFMKLGYSITVIEKEFGKDQWIAGMYEKNLSKRQLRDPKYKIGVPIQKSNSSLSALCNLRSEV